MNRDELLYLNALVDTQVQVREPGEVLTDVDDIPTAVAPTQVFDATVHGVIVTAGELQAAGLTPQDVPNLRVIDPEGENTP